MFLWLVAFHSRLTAQNKFPIIHESHCDTIKQGEYCVGYFTFRNESDQAVRISIVSASTSNFAPNWRIDTIHPGDTACVTYVFATAGKLNHYMRDISVTLTNGVSFHSTVQFFITPKPGFTQESFPDTIQKPSYDSTKPILKASEIQPEPVQAKPVDTHLAIAKRNDSTANCAGDLPLYPGGNQLFIDSLVKVTTRKIQPTKTGTIYVRFTITKNGHLIDPIILRSVDPVFEKELLANMPRMGKWIPACYPQVDPGIDEPGIGTPASVTIQYPIKIVAPN
jgi:hypothetical protein